jgi:hypothetical protein
VLPQFRGRDRVGVDLGVIVFKPGEHRLLNAQLRLATGGEGLPFGR